MTVKIFLQASYRSSALCPLGGSFIRSVNQAIRSDVSEVWMKPFGQPGAGAAAC